jgi:hypothetical protein
MLRMTDYVQRIGKPLKETVGGGVYKASRRGDLRRGQVKS